MKKITLITSLMLFISVSISSQITLVKDILQTDGDAWVFSLLDGGSYTVFMYNGNGGSEIWASNGTEAGTKNIGGNIPDIFNMHEKSIVFNNELYFVLETGDTGAEVFKTDGTEAGTTIVKDINTNPNSGSNPDNFIIFNNELYFTADADWFGTKLWKTDGTEAGTTIVNNDVKYPSNLTVFNDNLYFLGEDENFDSELWKTDGTEAGTEMLKNISPVGSSSPHDFIVFNNELFFAAYTDTSGEELWKTDGTEAGTVMLKEINNGDLGSDIGNLIINNNSLMFSANDNINGRELWKTDGTEAGTVMVKNISTGDASTIFNNFIPFDATTTFFLANTEDFGVELWKTDGTEAGTILVKDINPGVESGISEFSSIDPIVQNGIMYFSGNDGVNGFELWKTDGTEVGTLMIKDINSDNTIDNGRGVIHGFSLLNNKVVFEAFSTDTNRELWQTDGTEAGTVIIKDMNPGRGWGTSMEGAVVINNTLIFNGSNGINGFELWKTDGTEAGTVMLKNLNGIPNGSNPSNFAVALDRLYIQADSTNFGSSRLFATDGITSDWVIDNDNGPIIGPKAITEYKDKAYFVSTDFSEDYGIFYTDLENSKEFVTKINPGGFANISSFFHYENTNELFFAADDGVNGKELWKTDGTDVGTVLVKDIEPGENDSSPSDFFEFNNNLYFMTTKATSSFPRSYKKTLWKTDGTEAGTILVKEFDFYGNNYPPYFTEYKSKLYFTVFDNSTGAIHLWRTDGTEAGTEAAYVGFDYPNNMIVINDEMFLAATNGEEGQEMWKYDGENAEIFKAFYEGASTGYAPFTNFRKLVNGNLYFTVYEEGSVKSLWKSDGTDEGTVKLLDNFSYVNDLAMAGDILYLSLNNDANGTELWKTDGTEAGTVLVQDLYPGEDSFGFKNSSNPSNLTALGNDLYFSANTLEYGLELFKLENAVLNVENQTLLNLDLKVNVYPNPASTTVTISSLNNDKIQKIEVYNIMGKRVLLKASEDENNKTLDVSRLSSGIYIIKANINNTSVSKKLIIK
ncbi:T9SS type A sorting domain-containing protein [Polaribacter sp. MSW13]|uniref:T9SS type A sorting domain-containing protein n=1 Tax=Polaribacter marinus TaxID=2916838 RepID=A0A9X1VTS2_9FLAO|nr:ELWxxDGT repeat protein [Polaribacter marinus]MCI2229366.1 T9SS type A sorting domain-containing protein [Polaribacter marinus]